ncbi:Putative DEAD-box ATP-dependent RNA helicase 33 [Linum grandiflorum]
MALSMPTHLSFSKPPIPEYSLFLSEFSHLSIRPKPMPRKFTVIRMGGGPRTYPGGVSRWQWKRMQAKKAKQLLKARLSRERQIYEMRKRAELKAAVADLERPWEVVNKAPTLFSVSADEQVKVLADRFQKPGGFDLWTDRDGPELFKTHDGIPSARFFPKGVVHSVKPYGRIAGLDDSDDGELGWGSDLDGESGAERHRWRDRRGESEMNGVERHGRRRRFGNLNFPDEGSGLEAGNSNSKYSSANSGVNRNVMGRRESENSKYSSTNSEVSKNVLGRRGSENLKHSGGNSTVNRNGRHGGEMRNKESGRFGNTGEGSGQVVYQRKLSGRTWSNKSSSSSSSRLQNKSNSRMQNNGDVGGQVLVKSRTLDSGNDDASFKSQMKSRGRTLSSRREHRTSWTRNDNSRSSEGYVKSRSSSSSKSEVYDMRLQQDGTYGFPDRQY